jgi:hypothetical protein
LVQDFDERVKSFYDECEKKGKSVEKSEPPFFDTEEDAEGWWASMRTDTNRPIKSNQQQRYKQTLTAIKRESTGLHSPNEKSKMMLFITLEMI